MPKYSFGDPKAPLAVRLKQLLMVLAAIAAFVLVVPPIVLLASWQPYTALAISVVAALGAYWSWRGERRLPLTGKWAVAVCLFGLLSFWSGETGNWAIGDRRIQLDQQKERVEREAREKVTKAAAEQEEQRKREAAEMATLRKINPDEYLLRLKEKDMSSWLDEAKILRPKLFAAHQDEMRRQSELTEYTRQRKSPKDYLTLDFTWSAGGFGSVMVVNFTIKSTLQFPVRDILVRCIGTGNSGTEIGSVSQTIYETVPAKGTKRINKINMGFIPGQMRGARCEILSVQKD